jgi:hypothetical protein
MEFAALASFAILLVAWIVAPDAPRRSSVEVKAPEVAEPIAA